MRASALTLPISILPLNRIEDEGGG
jgi:hypothetical protein